MRIRPAGWPAWVWMILVTILLILPGSAFPQENWMSKLWLDKWIHIGLFAVMVFLWCWSLTGNEKEKALLQNRFLWITLFAFAYGTGMEFVQKYFVANRSFDIGDIAADGIGALTGWLFSRWRYIKK